MFQFLKNKISKKVVFGIIILLIIAGVILKLTYFSPAKMNERARYYYSEALAKVYSDPKKAESDFGWAVFNDPQNSGYIWQLAVMEARNGHYKKSVKNYDKLLKMVQTDTVYWEAGNAYLSLNKPNTAKEYYRKSIELNPYFEDGYFSLANLLAKEGSKEEAMALFKDALKYLPNSSKLSDLLKTIQTE